MNKEKENGKATEFATQENIRINVNGRWYEFKIGQDIMMTDTLSLLLREKLGLTGVRVSCEQGACGACTVLMNDKSVLSCMMLAVEADGAYITTIEGLKRDDEVVEAFVNECAPGYGTTMQCGFCTPGFIMEAHGLLNKNPHPTMEEIKDGLSGHICRCGCYKGIAHAVERAAEKISGKEEK